MTYGKVTQDWLARFRPIFEEMARDGHSPIDYAERLPAPVHALAPTCYAGRYLNDLYGPLDILRRGRALTMRQGLTRTEFSLTHYNHNTFYYATTGENAVGLSGVTFTIGATGAAIHVTVENLDREGLGTFTRTASR